MKTIVEQTIIAVIQFIPEYYGDAVTVYRAVTKEQIECPSIFLEKEYGKDAKLLGFTYHDAPELVTCRHCDAEGLKDTAIESYFYDTPWDESPEDAYYCSDYCVECQEGHFYSKDFSCFRCISCDRVICEQNPANGWYVQVRYIDEEPICLQCYEKHLYENGIDIESFEERTLKGMFFNASDLTEAGYEQVEGYTPIHIHSRDSVDLYCKKAIELITAGHKVINEYDRLGIGGGEGYVTLWKQSS